MTADQLQLIWLVLPELIRGRRADRVERQPLPPFLEQVAVARGVQTVQREAKAEMQFSAGQAVVLAVRVMLLVLPFLMVGRVVELILRVEVAELLVGR